MKAHQKVFVIINSRIDNEETGQTAMKRKYCFFNILYIGFRKKYYSNRYLVVRQKYTFVFSCEISLQRRTGHCIVSPALNVLLL